MSDPLQVDLCVIGAGSAGLSVAAGASQMGASVVLVEKGLMGGDCLNTGCVPSKSLLASAHAAWVHRSSGPLGVVSREPEIDFTAVMAHVRGVVEAISPMDSVERYEGFGVTVLQGVAKFTGPQSVQVSLNNGGEQAVQARRVVIATGSSPKVPGIPGLQDGPILTNETLFALNEKPGHLLVLGGGPIGSEMAQAFRRLGVPVTVIDKDRVLNREDPELAAVAVASMARDGIEVRDAEGLEKVDWQDRGDGVHQPAFVYADGTRIEGTHLLVAAGRAPSVYGLDLEKAGVTFSPQGIEVDARLRTSNKKVFAIGDVAGGLQFTHVAGYHAGVVIKNALFRIPAKADHSAIPRVTYTDPEVAQVGLTEAEAEAAGLTYQILRFAAAENDRAKAEAAEDGLIKVIVTPKGKILGAGLACKGAGELILPWVLALQQGLKISAMATVVAPYPTFSELSKRAAGSWYVPKLFSEKTRRMVRFLARFG